MLTLRPVSKASFRAGTTSLSFNSSCAAIGLARNLLQLVCIFDPLTCCIDKHFKANQVRRYVVA